MLLVAPTPFTISLKYAGSMEVLNVLRRALLAAPPPLAPVTPLCCVLLLDTGVPALV